MLKHVAVRLKLSSDGEKAFAIQKSDIVNSVLEKRDPALRNIIEALQDRGLAYSVDGCDLYWFQVDDERTPCYYQKMNEVEVVFSSEWFEKEKEKIRHYGGIKYYDACSNLVQEYEIKNQQRKIQYSVSRS